MSKKINARFSRGSRYLRISRNLSNGYRAYTILLLSFSLVKLESEEVFIQIEDLYIVLQLPWLELTMSCFPKQLGSSGAPKIPDRLKEGIWILTKSREQNGRTRVNRKLTLLAKPPIRFIITSSCRWRIDSPYPIANRLRKQGLNEVPIPIPIGNKSRHR